MLCRVFIAQQAQRTNFAFHSFELFQLQNEVDHLLHDLYLETVKSRLSPDQPLCQSSRRLGPYILCGRILLPPRAASRWNVEWGSTATGSMRRQKRLGTTVSGKLELIVGPMRSDKTAELLRRIETRRQYAKQYVMLLKPSDDTKAAAGLVESRNQNGCGKMEAVEFRSADPWTVLPVLAATEQQIGKRVECIAIDEGQFVQDLFAFTRRLLETGYDVMVSGLELDFRGMPFGEMMDLAWLVRTFSGNITELVAYCCARTSCWWMSKAGRNCATCSSEPLGRIRSILTAKPRESPL